MAIKITTNGGTIISNKGQIKGLIYAPFIEFIRQEFSIDAEIATDVTAGEIAGALQGSDFFIASVHHSLRWPDRLPPIRGDPLVLSLEATVYYVLFHSQQRE